MRDKHKYKNRARILYKYKYKPTKPTQGKNVGVWVLGTDARKLVQLDLSRECRQ